jgi:hypothetical protein
MPKTTTLVVTTQPDGSTRAVRDLRDESGDGPVAETVALVTPTASWLRSVRVQSHVKGLDDDRRLVAEPQQLILEPGSKPDEHRQFTLRGNGVNADVSLLVVGEATLATSAGPVSTIQIHFETTFTGEITGRQDATVSLARDDLLAVKEDVHTAVRYGLNDYDSKYVVTLKRGR